MSDNPLFSTWVGGRLPSNPTATSRTDSTVARRIRQGKQTRIKTKDEQAGPKHFNAIFIAQLDLALVDRASELKFLNDVRSMPAPLPSLINRFFAMVVKSNDATTKHRGQKPPKTLKNAEQLLEPMAIFKKQAADAIPASKWGLLLCTVLDELIGDIEHFVWNIRLTSGIVKVSDYQPKIRNRPTNRAAQEAYASIVAEHMALHRSEKFPKLRDVQQRLKLLGHTVADRTLRDWKAQIQSGVMGDFVQNRKRQ